MLILTCSFTENLLFSKTILRPILKLTLTFLAKVPGPRLTLNPGVGVSGYACGYTSVTQTVSGNA